MERIRNYIGGELVEPVGRSYLDNVDPAVGCVYSEVPDSDERDVELAVSAARSAFPAWSATPVEERSRILWRLADKLEENLDRFARAECVDNGKPLALARSLDVPRAIQNLRFFATAIVHFPSETHAMAAAVNYTLRQARGVTGLISPWNLPLHLFTWKVAPAISVGNTAVAKPSELTPMTAYLFCDLCRQVALPPGVLNVVHGTGPKAGAPLVEHKHVGTLSFTGSTRTGAEIARTAGPLFKKLSLEMGGKNPNIVFADADLDAAVAGSIRAAFANQGQVCLCGSRLLVEHSIHDAFLERFLAKTRTLRVGDPLESGSDLGAVVSRQHQDKILYHINLAREEGGKIECGGRAPEKLPQRCRNGFFVEPTVVTGLGPGCRTNQEEIFGPVVAVIPFADEREALELANATDYGLSASMWTRDVSRAHRLAERIEAGTVWVNCWMVRDPRVPFGGVKNSGVGREGGEEALRFFTEPKNVCIQFGDKE